MRPALKADQVTLLKPDRLNGTQILRGVDQVGGVRIQSATVVFPPTMGQSPPPVLTLEEQTANARARLVQVAEYGERENPVVLTLLKFKAGFTRAIAAALYRSAWIERERIKAELIKAGQVLAARAIDGVPLPKPYIPPPTTRS